ncbi:hypothetical protein SBV1_80009 [Verrucomicrobia bacterium]|nr:hypothetical protein SBV1_80009 [Verrucomicrobiota bacterium]
MGKSTAPRLHIRLKFQEIRKKVTDQLARPQPIAKTLPEERSTMKTTTFMPELFRLLRDTVVILADVVSALLAPTTP